jgi:hypothetical protein
MAGEPGPPGVGSSLPIFPDQFHSTGAVGTLAGANGRRPLGDLRSAHPRALGEDAPRLLLDRHAAETRLLPQPLGYLVIEIPDDDRRHDGDIVSCLQRYASGYQARGVRGGREAPRRQLKSAPPQEEPPERFA